MKRDKLLEEVTRLYEVAIAKWRMNSEGTLSQAYYDGESNGIDLIKSLIIQLDEPEKIVIPQFVADWWERVDDSVTLYGGLSVGKKSKLYLISKFYDMGLSDYLSKVEKWIVDNNSTFLDLVNGKPYEIEKEKLYYVKFIDDNELSYLNQSNESSYTFISIITSLFNNKTQFTEQEIKSINEHYWQFAQPVEEETP